MSIAQVVRNIIDQLSDGISQLVLTVVVLSEQNAEIQPGLPEGANAVNETARTLAKIARQLAGTNYKNFPPIAAEINEASDAVDVATGTMSKAISQLVSGSDRRAGWNGLVEACRVMSGKTIRLLQIVYGADLQRLMFVADNLMDMLEKVDTNDLKTNPAKFRDAAQAAANQTNQMAQYLNQRAQDTESPLAKAQMMEDAKKLSGRAQEMIQHINNCLTNPNDPTKAKAANDFLEQVKKDVKAAQNYTRENAPEAPQVVLPPGMADVSYDDDKRHPNEEQRRQAGNDSFMKNDLDKAKQQVKAVVNAAEQGNVPALGAAAKDLRDTLNTIQRGTDSFAANPHVSSAKKQDAQDTAARFNESFAPLIQNAKTVTQNPNNAEAKKNLGDVGRDMEVLVDSMARATAAASLNENLEKMKTLCDQVASSKHQNDSAKLTILNKELNQTKNLVKEQITDLCSVNKSAAQKGAIIGAFDAVDSQVNIVTKTSVSASSQTVQSDVTSAKKKIDDLIAATNAKAIAAVDDVRRPQQATVASSHRKDPANVQKDAAKVKTRVPALINAAGAANKNPHAEPEQRARINQAKDNVEQAAKHFDKAALRAASNPNAGHALDEAADDLFVAVGHLDDALANAPEKKSLKDEIGQLQNDFYELPSRAKDTPEDVNAYLQDALSRLKDANARVLGSSLPPQKKQDAEEAVKKTEALAPKIAAAIQNVKANPNDPRAKAEAEKLVADVNSALDLLASAVAPPSIEDVAADLCRTIDVVAEDPVRDAPKKLSNMGGKHNEFRKLAKDLINQNRNPEQREKLFDDLEGLGAKVDRLEGAVHDKKPQNDIVFQGDDTKRKVNDLVRKLIYDQSDAEAAQFLAHPGATKDSVMKDEIAKAKRKIKEIVQAAENENPNSLVPAINELKDILETIQRGCQKLTQDPAVAESKRFDIADTSNGLGDNFSTLVSDAKAAIQGPNKKPLASSSNNLDKLLDQLSAATAKPSLDENLDHLKKLVGEVESSKQRNDQSPALHKLIKQMKDAQHDVKDQAGYIAAVNKNPKQRKHINGLVEDLDSLVDSLANNVVNPRAPLKEVTDDAGLARKKIDELKNRSHANPLAKGEDLNRANDAAVNSAHRHNPSDVQRDAAKVKDRTAKLIGQCDQVVKSPHIDPDQQKKLKQAMEQVKNANEQFGKAASAAAANPEKAKHNLRDAGEDIKIAVAELENALKNVQSDKADGGSDLKNEIGQLQQDFWRLPTTNKDEVDPALSDALRRLKDAQNRVLAENAPTPQKQKEVAEVQKQTEKIVPNLQKAVQDAKNNPGKRPEAEKYVAQVNAVLDQLKDVAAPPTLQEAADKLYAAINKVLENPNSVTPQVLNDLAKKNEEFQNVAAYQIRENRDPAERANLQNELDNLNNQIARLGDGAKQKKPAAEVNNLGEDSKRKLADLLKKMHGNAIDDAEKVAKAATALKAVSLIGDDPSPKANDLKAHVAQLQKSLPAAAASLPAEKRAKVLDALAKAVNAADQEIDAASNGRGQDDQPAKVKNACADVLKAIGDIKDTLANRDPNAGQSQIFFADDEFEDSSEEEAEALAFDPSKVRGPPVAPPDHKSPLLNPIARLRESSTAVKNNADKQNPQGVATNAARTQKDLQDVQAQTRKVLDKMPAAKHAIVSAALQQVEKALPEQLDSAKKLLGAQTPHNKWGLENDTAKLHAALDALERATKPTMADEIQKMRQAVDDMADAHKRGDRNAVHENANKIIDNHPKVAKEAQFLAQETKSDPTRVAILQPLGSFKKILPDLAENAKRGVLDPSEIRAAHKALDDLEKATAADTLASIKRLNDIADDLVGAANNGDVATAQVSSNLLAGEADNLAHLAKANANRSEDPVQKERINSAVAELPHAVKNVLVQSKRALDSPDDVSAKVAARDAQKELADLTLDLAAALLNNVPVPQGRKDLDAATSTLIHLVPKLDDDTVKLRQNERDPAAKKAVIKDANKIGGAIKNLGTNVVAIEPAAIAVLKAEGVRERLKDIAKAVEDNNEPRYQAQLRKLERDIPALSEALRRVPHGEVAEIAEAARDIERYAPVLARLGAPVFRNPNDTNKKNDFAQAAKNLDRVVIRATRKAVPVSNEKEILDVAASIRATIAARKAARANAPLKPASTQPPEEDWRQLRFRLRKAADNKAQWVPEADGPSKELRDLWQRFEQKNKSHLSPQEASEMDNLETQMINSIGNLARVAQAEKLAPVIEAEQLLDDVLISADIQETERVKPQLGQLNNKLKEIAALNQTGPAQHSASQLQAPMKDVIVKALAVQADPNDEVKIKELKEAVERAKVTLVQIKKDVEPEALQRNAELQLQKTKAALADVDAANRSGNPAQLTRAVAAAKAQAQIAAIETAKLASIPNLPPSKKRNLQVVAKDLEITIAKLDANAEHPSQVTQQSLRSDNAVEEALKELQTDSADNLLKATAGAANTADLLTSFGKQMSPKEVQNLSSQLSGHSKNVIETGKDVSRDLGAQEHSPIVKPYRHEVTVPQAVNLIAQTKKGSHGPTPVLDVVVADLQEIAFPKPKPQAPPTPRAPPQRQTPQTFEDVVENVAEDISFKAREVECAVAGDIGIHLAALGRAARSGDRQQMLQEARAAAVKIQELCKLLREYAGKIQGRTHQEKVIQDRLIRAAQSLQNYGTQLKILTSVKAASLDKDKDTDESLTSIVRGIGSQVSEGLTSMDISDRTLFKTKK